ncbi:hypothetical protein Vadar_032066 [Vaccinium darrowii]|uniref:Uncharacterized protein n=1 Tax=Vaccinium darrowii TaxID=229202 RepID=A0ACB7XWB4_9ERIC|nr:hypothetical protein Vadar_032066 [Vaccinium darrowii]
MATAAAAIIKEVVEHHPVKCVDEEEIEREIDVNALLQSHSHLCCGISPLDSPGRREPTVNSAHLDDGSADVAEKCPAVNQQADHFKCITYASSS